MRPAALECYVFNIYIGNKYAGYNHILFCFTLIFTFMTDLTTFSHPRRTFSLRLLTLLGAASFGTSAVAKTAARASPDVL